MNAGAEKCAHCKGPIEVVGRGRYNKPIKQCLTCGREPDTPAPAAAPTTPTAITPNGTPRVFSGLAPDSAPRPCRVDGCPGTLDASGACTCCAKRAAWELEHAPIRKCEVCDGRITGPRNRKFCEACRKARARVGMASAKQA